MRVLPHVRVGMVAAVMVLAAFSPPLWGQAPSAVSVTPSSGSGSSQTFTFLYSDPNGFTDLVWTQVNLSNPLSGPNSCYVHYARVGNAVSLLDDTATIWLGPRTLGSGTALQNSECTLNPVASSASGSGNNLTLNLALTFSAAWAGAKNIYMATVDNGGLGTGWQARGTWTVPASSQAPSAVSVTPSSGSGSSQTLSFLFSDPNGFTDLVWTQMNLSTPLSGPNACYAHYDRVGNAVSLLNDSATTWLGPRTLGSGAALQNSQCTLNPVASSASGSGNNLTVNLALSFSAGWAGTKNIYMATQDTGGLGTGWQTRGTWTVPSAGGPTITTASPLPDGTAGVAYSRDFIAQGGTPPYTWSVISGQLPAGLSLSSGGLLSGTPTASGTYGFTVQAAGGGSSNKAFGLTILAAQTPPTSALSWDTSAGGSGPPAAAYPQCGTPNCYWVGSSVTYVSPGQGYGHSTQYSTGPDSWNTVNYVSAKMLKDGADLGSSCANETISVGGNVADARVPCNGSNFYFYAPSFYSVVGRHRASNTYWIPNNTGTVQSYASLGFVPAGGTGDFTVPQDGLSNTSQATGPTIAPNDGTTASYLSRSNSSVAIRVTIPYTAVKGFHLIGFPTNDKFGQSHRNENLGLVVYDDTPAITNVSPSSIPAGAPTALTITGSGFGDHPTVYVAGTAYPVSALTQHSPGSDTVTVTVNVPVSQGGSSVSVYLVSNGAGGQAFFGKPLGSSQGSPTSNTRQVPVVGPPTISGNQGIWYLGVAAVNDNCDAGSPEPSCYYTATRLTVTPGAGGTPPTASAPATWILTDASTGQAPTFATSTCDDAGCSQMVLRASSQPPTCATVSVQATLAGVPSAPFAVRIDWPSTSPAVFWQDLAYQDSNNRSGFISNNTLQLVSACLQPMTEIAAHEEFPASPGACGGSSGWTDPVAQSAWGSWITERPGQNAGMFLDQILYGCAPGTCTPQPQGPGNPLSSQANSAAALFIFVGSTDTQNRGKYFTAEPLMQVRYTDHGRDEPGWWRCP